MIFLRTGAMKKILIPIALVAAVHFTGIAQSDVDAFRYSKTFNGGTARFLSMGGAFGSLGADFSTIGTNPAGLGLFTKSEVSVSPAFFVGKTNSDYNGYRAQDSRFNFNVSNAGFVMAAPPKDRKGSFIKNYQFSFGVNRVANFNNRMLMEGFNDENSIIDTYVDWSNGINYIDIEDDPNGDYAFDLNPAWYTYMIDTIPGYINQYYGAVPPGGGILQRKELNTWGSVNEMVMAFSANLDDRAYFGVTLGFPILRYFEESYYTEIDRENNINDFNRLSIYENLATRGSGFNIKFGTIIRVTDNLRIGGAVHSPTWYNNLRDEWYSVYSTDFDNGDNFNERSPYGSYDYRLETPWKALGSMSVIIGQRALLSAEYEFMDYSKSKLRGPGYSFYDVNYSIQNKYKATHYIRGGTEIRFGQLSARGGGGYGTSPFAENINDGSSFFYSLGFGFRDKNFFFDLAYVQTFSKEDYYLYSSETITVDPVKNQHLTYNLIMTMGFRF